MDLFEIMKKITPEIKKNPHVHAMWLEGSYATGKNNENSDIDVWMDVDDGMFQLCLDDFRNKLKEVTSIQAETTKGTYSTNPKLFKQTFILKGYKDGQDIELDMQEHSREFIFSRTQHVIKVLLDKDQTIKWED